MADAPVPDDAASLRAANARLRALLAERDAEIAERDALITVLRGQLGELAVLQVEASELRERAAGLEAQVAELAVRVGAEFAEQLEAALVGRAGEARAEVAAGEVRAEAWPAQGAAGSDDAAVR